MARLAGGRVYPELILGHSRFAGVAWCAAAVEQDELFDARLLAKALYHLRDQGAVVAHHLMFERGADQLSFGEGAGACRFHEGMEMTGGKDVGGNRAGHHHRGRDTEREANGHAGKTQLHDDGTKTAG